MTNGRLINGATLLLARTVRSSIYLQSLAHAGMKPERVLLYGAATDTQRPPAPVLRLPAPYGHLNGNLAAEEVLNDLGWPYIVVSSRDMATPELIARMDEIADQQFVVFSSYPGQIVPETLLARCPFIHLHSGWLPHYRGSTTMYYAMLAGDAPGVTALQVDTGIDTGRILAQAHYPLPPANCDIDYMYDNAIRGDLLAKLMDCYVLTGSLPPAQAQPGPGTSYYVIHPVLKTLALLAAGWSDDNRSRDRSPD